MKCVFTERYEKYSYSFFGGGKSSHYLQWKLFKSIFLFNKTFNQLKVKKTLTLLRKK